MKCWWIFGHDWGKWEVEKDATTMFGGTPINTKRVYVRVCEKCGRPQIMSRRLGYYVETDTG